MATNDVINIDFDEDSSSIKIFITKPESVSKELVKSK